MKKKLIIDADIGVDNAQALMVAIADDVEILGITCCYGNTPLENVLHNTLRVLKVFDGLDVSLGFQTTAHRAWGRVDGGLGGASYQQLGAGIGTTHPFHEHSVRPPPPQIPVYCRARLHR